MKKTKFYLYGLCVMVGLFAVYGSLNVNDVALVKEARPDKTEKIKNDVLSGKVPLYFEPNIGQSDEKVDFISRGLGYSLFLSAGNAVLALNSPHGEAGSITPDVIQLQLLNANNSPEVLGRERFTGKSNYFIGNDQTQWHTNVPHYGKVEYSQIYPGIDLVYYGTEQRLLEHDFVVEPYADPKQIQFSIEGAQALKLDDAGNLMISTSEGQVVLQAPITYQDQDNKRVPVESQYTVSDNVIGFELASYDVTRPVVIDPVLSYSTYFGGSGGDIGNDMVIDDSGKIYITGSSSSSDLPLLSPFQATNNGIDAMVAVFDSTGSSLLYATYLGGSGSEIGRSIAVDNSGNVYVTGEVSSTDFPLASAFQSSKSSLDDAFVSVIDSSGSGLIYSTYLGGSSADHGFGIAVDDSGNAYVTGSTSSTNFPTLSAYQTTKSDWSDVFLTVFNSTGSGLIFSTYLGGDGTDEGNDIVLDSSGNIYITGWTGSTDYPVHSSFQSTLGGNTDAFVSVFNSSGSGLIYSTYLGGGNQDKANAIVVDNVGNAYITGHTLSTDFPIQSAYQSTKQSGIDVFISALDHTGSTMMYSTYLGGGMNDEGIDIARNGQGEIFVVGKTASTDFPIVSGHQSVFGGVEDAFLVALDNTGSTVTYSTYLGGNTNDSGQGVVVDELGQVWATGLSFSGDFPVQTALQSTSGGSVDIFLTKFTGFSSSSSLSLTLPDVTASLGDTLSIPVQVSNLSPFGVIAAEVFVAFDTTVVKSAGVTLTGGLAATNWFEVNNVVQGVGGIDTLKVVMFTAQDTLAGAGDLVYLNFVATGPNTSTALEVTHSLFNNDTVPDNIEDGSVQIQGAGGGEGLVVSMPDTVTKYDTTIDVPIRITDTSGLGIVASEISVTYRNDIVLSALTNFSTTAGTVTTNAMVYQGWSVEENVFSGSSVDTLTIAMSTAQDTLTGAGDLIYLTLQVADIREPDSTPLDFVNVLFNDGTPSATSVDGSLTITGTDAALATSPDSIRPDETVNILFVDSDLDLDVGVAEQVSVTAFSVTYGDSQSVWLTETGVNTGEFTGSVATEFSASAGTPQDGVIGTIAGDSIGVVAIDVLTSTGTTALLYASPVPVYGGEDGVVQMSYVVQAFDGRDGVRDTVRVQVTDADLDLDVGLAESVSATITNAISGESESVLLTETDVNTGVFQARVPTIAGASGTNNDGVLSLASWDTLTVEYVDSLSSQGGLSTVSEITRVVNVFGDVAINDEIQAFDAARLLAISVGLVSSNTQTTLVGDVDGSGDILAFDASLVLQYVVRLIDRFPVQTDTDITLPSDPKNHPFLKPVLGEVIALGEMMKQDDGTYLVPVQLAEREGVLSATLTLGMDAGVEVVGVTASDDYRGFLTAHNETNGSVRVAFAGSKSELTGSGDMLMLRVRSEGDTPIRLSLDQVTLNGQSLTPGVNIEALEQVETSVPEFVTELHQNLPNPFNPQTTIRYGLADAGQVSVVIYSVTGQRVRTLVNAFQDAGAYQVVWDGRNALGNQVSSGVYLMRMQTNGFTETRKMMLMK